MWFWMFIVMFIVVTFNFFRGEQVEEMWKAKMIYLLTVISLDPHYYLGTRKSSFRCSHCCSVFWRKGWGGVPPSSPDRGYSHPVLMGRGSIPIQSWWGVPHLIPMGGVPHPDLMGVPPGWPDGVTPPVNHMGVPLISWMGLTLPPPKC